MANTKKVLVAEDSSVIQNLTKKVLQFQNYEIDSVKNGEEVLKAIEAEDYDIILMDIGMPKMDGMECTKQIRALEDSNKSNIPIVAITGNAKNYSEEEFTNVGINEYLQKPLNFDHLVEVVKKYTS
ncbi:two-component system cell cycle response regulator DivK [Catalinimonas alkaloidigena]|uniref:response regulator n=1 Tax=Catalinimonas alkaloidigena TaxID=1075417 RepID=UPI0024052BEB|nr:response regulator [Catalinimonas alkaloidigena]MDF9797700.1 two-component system cell cycle response regulator DivK [Catalinimonas alkaloidigena]